jgi:hypothetical protein
VECIARTNRLRKKRRPKNVVCRDLKIQFKTQLSGLNRAMISSEQFFPTRMMYVDYRRQCNRDWLAEHIRRLRKLDNKLGRKCRNYGIWIGFWPVSRLKERPLKNEWKSTAS